MNRMSSAPATGRAAPAMDSRSEQVALALATNGSVYASLKRALDIGISITFLLLLCPIYLAIALLVRLDSAGPVLFRQTRIGRDNSRFVIYKFRTMHLHTPDVAKSFITRTDPRITRVGRFLRRTSLDELPQLVNVLRGEMSLVGPRPALYNQADLIDLRTKAGVHVVKPGITGVAQISGREALSLADKVAHDRYYVDHASFWLDVKLLLQTPRALLSSQGTY